MFKLIDLIVCVCVGVYVLFRLLLSMLFLKLLYTISEEISFLSVIQLSTYIMITCKITQFHIKLFVRCLESYDRIMLFIYLFIKNIYVNYMHK